MKKSGLYLLGLLASASLLFSCSEDSIEQVRPNEIPDAVFDQVAKAGFSTDGIMRFEEGYLIENDIYLTDADLQTLTKGNPIPSIEQYSTTNLVSGTRTITLYASEVGRKGYSAGMIAGLDEAIARYNAMNLRLSFQRVSSKNADITMTRLNKGEERRGILGSAGFPTASGDPFDEIKMSGILESSYGLNTDEIATIIAHEMGHCIGFRHTDYFNRSISCGGSASNEGDGGIGANHIPGTPTGATFSAQSWMLSCTDGSNRPFNNDDKTALNYLY